MTRHSFHPNQKVIERPLVDSYGMVVTSNYRHQLCKCDVPCQGMFLCKSNHHRGSRDTPWCCGAYDAEEKKAGFALCDSCWYKRVKKRESDKKKRNTRRKMQRARKKSC